MKQYAVNISKTAFINLNSIKEYITYQLNSPETAQKQYNHIVQKIFSLRTFPKRHQVFFHENNKDFYRILADNYSIIYVIDKDTVKIIYIMYTASDILQKIQ